jgi:hypothetical protein
MSAALYGNEKEERLENPCKGQAEKGDGCL